MCCSSFRRKSEQNMKVKKYSRLHVVTKKQTNKKKTVGGACRLIENW